MSRVTGLVLIGWGMVMGAAAVWPAAPMPG
jgi:hypothetical protein